MIQFEVIYMTEINIRCGVANVTNRGLLFEGKHYSSMNMIKHRWFSIAESNGGWQIPVLYDTKDLHHLILLDFEQPEIALTIENNTPIDPKMVELYQEAIRNLKALLSVHRK
jgi:hypothetical protein